MTSALAPPRTARPLRADAAARRADDQAWSVAFAAGVGLVVTLGMWLRHGQLGAAHGPGGVETAIGQVAALTGTYAVLVQLLLMSRISWLERAVGLDRLARWHRWTGFAVVWLLTAHVAFTTLGWAQGSIPSVSLAHETAWLISHAADVLMAWVGFALFLAVAITSVRAARRSLRRETWYFVHLYAYLAIALSFAHQLAVGSDFDNDRAARVWWIALYVFVFGAIAYWRVIRPIAFNLRHRLRVAAVEPEAPGVVSVYVAGDNLAALHAEPGQFFLWRFLTKNGWWQPHPFSLSAAPSDRGLRITVKNLGDGTALLQKCPRGTRVFAEGPYGTFTARRRTRRRALLVAGGIGITPLRALLQTFTPDDDVVLLYRVARKEDVIFGDELHRLMKELGMTVHVIVGDEIGDDQTDLLGIPALQRGVPDIATRDCFVCGPPALVDAVVRRLRLLDIPRRQIHFERFEL